MVNRRRGEVCIILDGKVHTLCLTLAALAELEDSMGLDNIGELAERFAGGKVKSGDLVKILGAALRAGGTGLSDKEAASMHCDGGAGALTAALVDLLRLTFNPGAADEKAFEQQEEASTANPTKAGSHQTGRPA